MPNAVEETGPSVLDAARGIVKAISTADIMTLEGAIDPDATMFAPLNTPERQDGRDAALATFRGIFDALRAAGRTNLNLFPLNEKVQLLGDVAIVTFQLGEVPKVAIAPPVNFGRRTLVMQKKNGRWLLVHLHASAFQLTGPPG